MSDAIGRWSLLAAMLAAALLVDPFADAAFDAPKRLFVLAGACIAAIAWVWGLRGGGLAGLPAGPAMHASLPAALRSRWQGWPLLSRLALISGVAAAAGMVAATIASPYPSLALPALRTIAIGALLVPLGASRFFEGGDGARFLRWTVCAIALDALLSLAQAAGMSLPFAVAQLGGRYPTGALLGNEGYVALACAMLAAACLAAAAWANTRKERLVSIALIALALAAIAVNRQLTGALGLLAAAVVIVAVRWRLRWLMIGAAVVAAALILSASIPSLRALTWSTAQPVAGASAIEGYQRLTTWRLGAWIAASDMAAARPLTGFGPGTYPAEAIARRLEAEIRLRERLTQPVAASFSRAHQDYLQLAAEAGVPTLACVLAALALIVAGAVRRLPPRGPERIDSARPMTKRAAMPPSVVAQTTTKRAAIPPGSVASSNGEASVREITLLLAVLSVGLVAALAWFPLQIPLTAMLLLLACGRLWRIGADGGGAPAPATASSVARLSEAESRRGRWLWRAMAIAICGALLWPEVPRYQAEWLLAQANTRLGLLLKGRESRERAERLAGEAQSYAVRAQVALADDPRAALATGVALIFQRQGPAAINVLTAALAQGERPELTINLGRARGIAGDQAGAGKAFLRTAWVSPAAISTLPAAMRQPLLDEVQRLEAALKAGALRSPPPLD